MPTGVVLMIREKRFLFASSESNGKYSEIPFSIELRVLTSALPVFLFLAAITILEEDNPRLTKE